MARTDYNVSVVDARVTVSDAVPTLVSSNGVLRSTTNPTNPGVPVERIGAGQYRLHRNRDTPSGPSWDPTGMTAIVQPEGTAVIATRVVFNNLNEIDVFMEIPGEYGSADSSFDFLGRVFARV